MDKFQFVIDGPTLGNPYLEDTFFRSIIQRHFQHDPEYNSITKDLYLFGDRVHKDLLVKANDAEENVPKLKQINVYGEAVNDIQLALGWKTQAVATTEEGLMSIPYPAIDKYGWFKEIAHISNEVKNQQANLDGILEQIFKIEKNPLLISQNEESLLPQKVVYQHGNYCSPTARLHAFIKNLMYVSSSSMQSCPNAMTDAFSRLITAMYMKPNLFGKSQNIEQYVNNFDILHPKNIATQISKKIENNNPTQLPTNHKDSDDYFRSLLDTIPMDELLLIQASHYALASTTSKTASNPLSIFQPSYKLPLSKAIQYNNTTSGFEIPLSTQQSVQDDQMRLKNGTIKTIFSKPDTSQVHKNNPTLASTTSTINQPRKPHDSAPNFWTSGQWMTSARGGSDVSSGTVDVAFPMSFSTEIFGNSIKNNKNYKINNETNTVESTRIFSLYGLKYFTSAIDSKYTVTLARVLTPETWKLACDKLNNKYKTDKFSFVSPPSVFGKIIIPDNENQASASYYLDGVLPYADFTTASSFNNVPTDLNNVNSQITQITQNTQNTQYKSKKLVKNTDLGSILENLDPLSQILQAIPLTCFLVFIKSDQGCLNYLTVQRLKEKFGTKQLPTAELLMQGTIALRLSEYGKGISLISLLFNLTRLHNSVSACGYTARLLLLNRNYQKKRYAFGSFLTQNATHANTIAILTAYTWATINSTMELSALQGIVEAIDTLKYYFKNQFLIFAEKHNKNDDKFQQIIKNILFQIYRIFVQIETSLGLPIELNTSLYSPTRVASLKHNELSSLLQLGMKNVQIVEPKLQILLRISTPIAKLSTAEYSSITSAYLTQQFGSLGYMEDSRIPRILRDVSVTVFWEGTKQVCAHDCIRSLQYRPQMTPPKDGKDMDGYNKQLSRVVDVDIVEFINDVSMKKIDTIQRKFEGIFCGERIDKIDEKLEKINQKRDMKCIVEKITPIELLQAIQAECPRITTEVLFIAIYNMFSTCLFQLKIAAKQWYEFVSGVESDAFLAEINGGNSGVSLSQQIDNSNSPKKIAQIRHTKTLLLEQHCVAIAQGLYQIQSSISLLEHCLYYMKNEEKIQHEKYSQNEKNNHENQQNQAFPLPNSGPFFQRLKINQSYGLPILFACYRFLVDSPYNNLGGSILGALPVQPKAFPDTPFLNATQLSILDKNDDNSTKKVPKYELIYLYKLLNQLISMDELPLLPLNELAHSRL